MDLDYTLAVLTHGRGSTLPESLRSFRDHVDPQPAKVLVYSDAGFVPLQRLHKQTGYPAVASYKFANRQGGFCAATAALWQWTLEDGVGDYVFWLEHDFVFQRAVELAELARPLAEEDDLAQMALMRNASSEAELAAGGLFELRWGDYSPRVWSPPEDTTYLPWQQHRAYFTTNPSLMRRQFMFDRPFFIKADQPECEGRYGLALVRDGYSFGVWGDGDPWVEHVGIRSGFGY